MANITYLTEFTLKTLLIKKGYKLIIDYDSEVGVIAGTFVCALQNEKGNIIMIEVAKDHDPEDIVVVSKEQIRTIIHTNGEKKWERVSGGYFSLSFANSITRSLVRTTANSNRRNKKEDDDENDNDSEVEFTGISHTNEDVDVPIVHKFGNKKK